MPITYDKPDDDTRELLELAIEQWHPALGAAEVNVSLLMAYGPTNEDGETTGYAITVRGMKALAQVKIHNLKLRAHGLGDAELLLDGDEWEGMREEEKLAILDHELTHLEVDETDDGIPKADDQGRPKLRIRLHDFEFGWFKEVAERHKGASQEVQQAQAIVADTGQLFFDFGASPIAEAAEVLGEAAASASLRRAARDFKQASADIVGPGGRVSISVGDKTTTVVDRTGETP